MTHTADTVIEMHLTNSIHLDELAQHRAVSATRAKLGTSGSSAEFTRALRCHFLNETERLLGVQDFCDALGFVLLIDSNRKRLVLLERTDTHVESSEEPANAAPVTSPAHAVRDVEIDEFCTVYGFRRETYGAHGAGKTVLRERTTSKRKPLGLIALWAERWGFHVHILGNGELALAEK